MQTNIAGFLALLMFLTLSACGGGGGGSTSTSSAENSTVNEPPSNQTLTSTYLAGIYCSCGPTQGTSSSINTDTAGATYMDGVLVRISWADINPAPDVYDWSLLEQQIQLAEDRNLDITLAILNGGSAPDWLRAEGVPFFDYPFRGITRSLPLPWDDVYLSYYEKFVAALGARFADSGAISLVHMTNSTTNGLEMQYVFDTATQLEFITEGYTEQKLIDSWQRVLDAYANAFPSTLLDVDVHPVFNSATVARSITDYGHTNIGKRFGVFAAWWSESNAVNVYPDMFDLLIEAQATSFAAVQLVGSVSSGLNPLSEAELFAAIQLAIDSGFFYIEVWNTDIANSLLASSLSNFDELIENLAVP
jgi:hypothetical protein